MARQRLKEKGTTGALRKLHDARIASSYSNA